MKPFAHYTTLTGAEEITTVSTVIPVILELCIHLEEMEKVHGLAQVANLMHRELHRWFKYAVDPDDTNFDPSFVTATLLGPELRDVLNDAQKKEAKQYILKLKIKIP